MNSMHPKVKAARNAAGTVVIIVVLTLGLFGVDVDDDTQVALLTIISALIPVVAGWLKPA